MKIVLTCLIGGTGWDYAFDVLVSTYDQNFFYVTGLKAGNYITASSTGGADPYVIKVKVSDGTPTWRSSVALDSLWDMSVTVAETSSTTIQLLQYSSAGLKFITFNAATGAYISNVQLPYSSEQSISFTLYDSTCGFWLLFRLAGTMRQFVALDSSATVRYQLNIPIALLPTAAVFDSTTFNLFLAYQESNLVSVAQFGILSGRIDWNRWTPILPTDSITSMKIVQRHLLVGGTGFARLFQNVTYQDSCPSGSIFVPTWTCQQCSSGTYVFNNTCTPCPRGSYCLNGTIFSCNNGNTTIFGASSSNDCICNPGFYGTNGNCTLCPRGSYCQNGSLQSCINGYTEASGSIVSSQCICNPGFYRVNANCVACPYGSICPGGNSRTICGLNSNTTEQSSTQIDQCVCNIGYFGSNGNCNSCPYGSYCSGGSSKVTCGPNSNTSSIQSTSSSQCVCNAGYYGQNGICTICSKGKYCPGGYLAIPCSINSDTENEGSAAVTQCLCKPGHYGTAGICQPCQEGYFQSIAGQIQCLRCPLFSASCDSISFSCLRGYTISITSENCIACSAGFFKSSNGNEPCQKCPENAIKCNETAYQCAGSYDPISNSCAKVNTKVPIDDSTFVLWWINNSVLAPIICLCVFFILFLMGALFGFLSAQQTPQLDVYTYKMNTATSQRPLNENNRLKTQSLLRNDSGFTPRSRSSSSSSQHHRSRPSRSRSSSSSSHHHRGRPTTSGRNSKNPSDKKNDFSRHNKQR